MSAKFKKWMDRKGYTIMSFAVRHGLDYNTVSKWMGGDRIPRKPYQDIIKQNDPDCPLIEDKGDNGSK